MSQRLNGFVVTDIYIDAGIDAVHLSQIACDTLPDDLMPADIDRS